MYMDTCDLYQQLKRCHQNDNRHS